jgi:hypothetical protein
MKGDPQSRECRCLGGNSLATGRFHGFRFHLARECAKLDPAKEKALAEEGMGEELQPWPEY